MSKFIMKVFGLQVCAKGMNKISKDLNKPKKMSVGKALFYSFTFSKMIGMFNWILKTNGKDK